MNTENFIPCSIKLLSNSKWEEAAKTAININPVNAPAFHQLRIAFPNLNLNPEYAIVMTTKYWGAGGVHLTVGFLDNPPYDLRRRIISHMNAWGLYANVQFVETTQNPQVRISRTRGGREGGYWSLLGTDILSEDLDKPTMNLDGFTMDTEDSEFFRVIRHETGHTLGFPHEHLRPEIVSQIDQEKAISYFYRTENWKREDVISQVLTPIDQSTIFAQTRNADTNSIMCYWLPAEIMNNGVAIMGGNDIDPSDADFASIVYPK